MFEIISIIQKKKKGKKRKREREKKRGVREIMNDRTDNLIYREDIKRSMKKKEIQQMKETRRFVL